MASTLQLTDSNPLLLKSSLLRSSHRRRNHHHRFRLTPRASSSSSSGKIRRHFISDTASAAAIVPLSVALLQLQESPARSEEPPTLSEWERVYLPIDPGVVLLDIAFVPDDPSHANRGYNWKAAVQETVSATLNRTVSSGISGASYYTGTFNTVNRSPDGRYVAISSRGNFYLTWEPGQPYWQPHNRAVARRIQNMGWRADGGLWLLVRGGGLYLSKGTGISEEFEEIPVQSRGFGILDVGYRSKDEAWAAGGSGVLLRTTNGGKSWTRDKAADRIAANLYSVKFLNDNKGFVLGNDGVLLRYLG